MDKLDKTDRVLDFSKMSDKQIIDRYYEAVTSETFNIMVAGLCAGELINNRDHNIIEEDGEKERFVKKESKKVA